MLVQEGHEGDAGMHHAKIFFFLFGEKFSEMLGSVPERTEARSVKNAESN